MATENDKRVMAHLVPDKHRQGDFFVLDMHDANPRDDLASMEHPLFALRAGDKRIRTYERSGYTVQVQPGAFGCATIHDKDIWLFCISQLVAAQNKGHEISRTIRFTAHEFLVATNRRTDGDSYERMSAAMDRLKGTTIKTDIKTDGRRERGWFGLIESARVIERDKDERMVAVEVTLPDWLYSGVMLSSESVFRITDYFSVIGAQLSIPGLKPRAVHPMIANTFWHILAIYAIVSFGGESYGHDERIAPPTDEALGCRTKSIGSL